MEPPCHILGEAPAQQTPDRFWRVRRQGPPVWILGQNRRHRVSDRVGVPRSIGDRRASQRGHSQTTRHPSASRRASLGPAPDSCTPRCRESSRPRHPRWRGHGRRVRHVGRTLAADAPIERLGEPEVQHLHGAISPHFDIRGFEIAMHDALLVGGFEGLGDLASQLGARRPAIAARARSAATDPRPRRVPSRVRGGLRPNLPRTRRSGRCADDSATRASALPAESGRGDRDRWQSVGENLQRDFAPSVVSRARYTSPYRRRRAPR